MTAFRLLLAALLLGPERLWAQTVKGAPVEVVAPVTASLGSAGPAPVLSVQPAGPGLSAAMGAPLSLPTAAVSVGRRPAAGASRAQPTAASELAGAAGKPEEGSSLGQVRFDQASPLAALDVLAAERPRLLAGRIARIREVEKSLVAAVGEAAAAAFGEPAAAVSRGSTARQTNDEDEADYDLLVQLPPSWGAERSHRYLQDDLSGFTRRLQQAAAIKASELFAGPIVASVGPPRRLLDPATSRTIEGVLMMALHVRDTNTGKLLVDADVSLTSNKTIANDYPGLFARQLAAIEAAGGKDAADQALSDIRLAKKFFRTAVGAYKWYQGGPGGVGIEQMVIHAGSFDRMVEKLFAAAIDERGQPRSVKAARRSWVVPNPYMAPDNFLALLSDGAWRHVAYASKAYLEARAAGRRVALADLKYRKPPPAPAPAPAPPRPAVSEHTTPQSARRELVLNVRSPRHDIFRAARRLGRRLKVPGRAKIEALGGRRGEWTVRLALKPDANPAAKLETALKFFQGEGMRARLLSASRPAEPEAPAASDAPGKVTLGLLEGFTLSGPRPADRGDAFLYAQGAKAVAPELEAAWAGRVSRLREDGRGVIARSILTRRDGRASIMVMQEREGRETLMPTKVPSALAQGIVSEAYVEARVVKGRVVEVRAVGAYPMDMMIGRVIRQGGALMLGGLISGGDRDLSLYAPLPIASSHRVREGQLLQAFVKPTRQGFEAVPLVDLGGRVTPEIAAREIALRHGARGYFERKVIEQAEETARTHDPAAEFEALRVRVEARGGKVLDMRGKPFVTIDPKGAGDLDDAFTIERHADGGWTWYLATADVAHFVKPGEPGFRAAARVGNTFYSIDKDGVPEFPMNNPVIAKSAASLLKGKQSLAMITSMRFGPDGAFLIDESDVALGIVEVQGRYDYDQVAALWGGAKDTGIEHGEQIALARELSKGLTRQDDDRGKLDFDLPELRHRKIDGVWETEAVDDPPIVRESHRLIEELKVYGNRVIATRLKRMSPTGAPHISRVHPEQAEAVNLRLRADLEEIGVPWTKGTIAEYLHDIRRRTDLSPRRREAAQTLVLVTRKAALYATDDSGGHEGLALEGGAYDHPSAPIRRFSDMYNRALLEAYLEGEDPAAVHAAVVLDLKAVGFADFQEYLQHLNGRALAARRMDYEVDDFMSVYELAKPENRGKTFRGYVKFRRRGADPRVEIALEGSPATVTFRGEEAAEMKLLEEVSVEIHGADADRRSVDFTVRRLEK